MTNSLLLRVVNKHRINVFCTFFLVGGGGGLGFAFFTFSPCPKRDLAV